MITTPLRNLVILAILIAGEIFSAGALAQQTREARLDSLFVELSEVESETAARALEERIWLTWLEYDDTEISAMMSGAIERIRWREFEAALEILDEIVARAPDYAEGWNQRATVHFMMGSFEKALWDVAETLKREPRHFGALAGRGVIRLQQGKPALGYQSILAAMEFHPFLRERDLLPESLRPGSN